MVYGEESLREPGRRLISRIENFCPYHAGFRKLVEGEKLLGRVEDLLGERAVLFKDKINFKLPGGDGFKAHQDQQAGWSVYASLFVTALVTIDGATEANGCLELAAGHHRRGLLGPEWAPLGEGHLRGVVFVPYPTAPGDVIFFDSYVPHRSGPNLSDEPRRVLYLSYNRLSEGDHRVRYYADKRKSFPPDVEREPGKQYVYRV
jgi:ectoine hydroxylase-related dioxygenase (phytanoyl-CoA dioxygenase family)